MCECGLQYKSGFGGSVVMCREMQIGPSWRWMLMCDRALGEGGGVSTLFASVVATDSPAASFKSQPLAESNEGKIGAKAVK